MSLIFYKLVHLIYRLYFIKLHSGLADQSYFRIMTRLANLVLPAIFKVTSASLANNIEKTAKTGKAKIIVSLTTYPARINKVWITIETILRQHTSPDLVILWLSADEFIDKSILPANLLMLEKRGLQIRFCPDNLMPHKKYFYAMKEFPDACIVTVDDDVMYAPDLLDKLLKSHAQYPHSICSAITREIKTVNGEILPYSSWKYVSVNSGPSFQLLSIGVGGTLFPPGSLNSELFNEEQLKKIALTADDLWLKNMSLLNKTTTVSIAGEYSRFFIPVIQKNKGGLMDTNIGQLENDRIFKDLMKYYQISPTIFESV